MPFSTYTQLQTSVADWLNRTDLTAQIPDFITLAEVEMKRTLRRATTRTTFTVTNEETTLPADCSELRSLSLESGSPAQDVPLRMGTPEMLAERRARGAAVAGRPTDGFVYGTTLVVAPVPDATYTVRATYFTQLIPLSGSNATNAVLTEAPDAYLYGALLAAAPYLEHDDRITLWDQKFTAAVDQLNMQRENEEHSASLRGIRLPIVFG